MKTKLITILVYTHYGAARTITTLINFLNCAVGLLNPRELLEYCFGYNPHKHRGWFVRTSFGWYWRCTHRNNDVAIKKSWFLRNLLRTRMCLVLPAAFIHACIHYSIGYALIDKPEKIGVYMSRYLKVIKDGYYNQKEKEYYVEEGGQRYECKR